MIIHVQMPDPRNEALKTAHEAINWYRDNTKPDNNDWSGHHDIGANALNEIEHCIGRPVKESQDTCLPF